MDEDIIAGDIAKEDVVDALADVENVDALDLVTDYYLLLSKNDSSIENRIASAKKCAQMIFDSGRYEEVVIWLDNIATVISDSEGPDSEMYMAFTENDELEALKLKAADKSLGADEEDDYDMEDE